jgi:Coenzyme PQQ synthesis protein D (PqqD)
MGSQFQVSSDAVAQRVGDEIVLVHLKTDRIFALNATGARIWELLQENCDRSALEQRLQQEFNVDQAQLEQQIDELLLALQKEDFINNAT